MLNCPRCHQLINNKAVNCPYCKTLLKAYGHPGITLHRANGEEPLCSTCTYHADDTCTFPQRPLAKQCTLYHDLSGQKLENELVYKPRRSFLESLRIWCQRNSVLVTLFALIVGSLLLTLMRQSK
jgi:uncharacterized Zn-finger protein